jgi:transmembrane sensor
MDKSTFLKLYEKYLAGNCTEEEKQLLEGYQDDFNITDSQWNEALMGDEKATRQAIWNQLQPNVSRKRTKRIITWATAACAIGVAVFLLYKPEKPEQLLAYDIQAGGNKATLVLGDGKTVALEQLASGTLREQDGVKINQQDGTIVFDPQTSATNIYNTVVTPKGGQYKVILPDGSKVFLNSASTLRFPAVFSGDQREVTLAGEAYFEIAKRADKPFSVKLKHGEIKVLGTHFNVKAYDEEPVIKATLLEGAVKVISESAGEVLKPGQQAVITESNLKVEEVNADATIAWTDGIFEFNGTDVKEVMQQLGRWYNVDIEYEQEITGKTFTGQLPKTVNASKVLKIIEQTGGVHFKITNQKIIVRP